jgi:hypothetical protein
MDHGHWEIKAGTWDKVRSLLSRSPHWAFSSAPLQEGIGVEQYIFLSDFREQVWDSNENYDPNL